MLYNVTSELWDTLKQITIRIEIVQYQTSHNSLNTKAKNTIKGPRFRVFNFEYQIISTFLVYLKS